jgi:hypothetical protein
MSSRLGQLSRGPIKDARTRVRLSISQLSSIYIVKPPRTRGRPTYVTAARSYILIPMDDLTAHDAYRFILIRVRRKLFGGRTSSRREAGRAASLRRSPPEVDQAESLATETESCPLFVHEAAQLMPPCLTRLCHRGKEGYFGWTHWKLANRNAPSMEPAAVHDPPSHWSAGECGELSR